MRRIGKGYSLALIFMLIGVFLWMETGYALSNLRLPLGSSNIDEAFQQPQSEQALSLEEIKVKVSYLAASISKQVINVRFCKMPDYVDSESLHSKFKDDRTYIKGIDVFLTTQIGHVLNATMSDRVLMIKLAFEEEIISDYGGDYKKPILEQVIKICEGLDRILHLDDEALTIELLKTLGVAAKFNGAAVDGTILSKVLNFNEVVTKSRELLEVYKNEIIKPDLFEIVRLCGENPEEVLKDWYGQPHLSTDQLILQAELSMLQQDWVRFNKIVEQLKSRNDVHIVTVTGPEMKNKEVNIDIHLLSGDTPGEHFFESDQEAVFLMHTLDNISDHVKNGVALVVKQTKILETGARYSEISIIDNGSSFPISIEEALRMGESPIKENGGLGLPAAINVADFSVIHIPGSSRAQGTFWESVNKKPSGTTIIGYFFIELTDNVEDARTIKNEVVEKANQYIKYIDEFSQFSITDKFPSEDTLTGI